MSAAVVVFANPAPKADPKPDVIAYSSPLEARFVPSAAIVERSYHGNLAYPYASAPLLASPYAYSAAYSAPILVR
jgi:hypothetical protein